MPWSASRAVCLASTCRGEATTGLPSSQRRSASTITVPGFQGTGRSVDRSGCITKSP